MEEARNNQTGASPSIDLSANAPIELPKLLLASSSPRRSEILRLVGWPFEKVAAEVDESLNENELAAQYVERLALAKAQDAASRNVNGLIVAADTTVVIDEMILAKPVDSEDAHRMLRTDRKSVV